MYPLKLSYYLTFKNFIIPILVIALDFNLSFSQDTYNQTFDNNLDEILFTRTTSYTELESLFREFKNDSEKDYIALHFSMCLV